jgi:hypothetical protein
MSNAEGMTNAEDNDKGDGSAFPHSGFVINSAFGIRISSFLLVPSV